jgi:transposase
LGYLWTSNIPGGSVFYHWHDGRDAAGLDALFEKQDETQLSDEAVEATAHHPVRRLQRLSRMGEGQAVDQAHGLPRPHAAQVLRSHRTVPRLVAWILRQIAHLYHIEERLREAKSRPALRQAVRAAESRMIHQRLHKAITLLAKRRILPKSKLGKAIHYASPVAQLELYLTDGRVEIDNNLVENAIRPTKLGAKNWLFLGNVQSGDKCAILYTIVENCRRLGIHTREYLEDVLTRLPAMKASEAASLTPPNGSPPAPARPARPAA